MNTPTNSSARSISTPHSGHVLMNEEIQAKLPPLYANESLGMKAIAPVKYFHPSTNWTWYATEYDPQRKIFFGLVIGHEMELGYFSLSELQEVGNISGMLPIERDLYYEPMILEQLKAMHCRE